MTSIKRKRLILDCDPGHDDAVAIMLAAKDPHFDLLGITTVAGNQTISKTTKNALNIVQHLDLNVPVFQGSARPIVREKAVIADDIHGESGLDGPEFDDLKIRAQEESAVLWIINTILKSPEPVTVVTCGPMTNLAMAIRLEPEIVENIESFVFMGGCYQLGNVTPAAEFNILADPEAAHIVFTSGIKKLVMVGLDVSRQCLCLPEIVERMSNIPGKAAQLFVDLMTFFNQSQKATYGWAGGPLHDPITIAYLINPDVLHTKYVFGEIDINGGQSYGRTNIDMLNYLKYSPNIYVADQVNVTLFWDIIAKGLEQYS